MSLYPAIFIDKDGTLVENLPYNSDPDRILLAQDAVEGLRLLHKSGYRLVIITNQSGIARGYFSEEAIHDIEAHLRHFLTTQDVPLAGFYYCPHHPEGVVPEYAVDCDCRKPHSGMITTAAQDLHLDLGVSWMIGDILNDVEAGHRAGCRSVLIDNGNETEWYITDLRMPDLVASDLSDAARKVLDAGLYQD